MMWVWVVSVGAMAVGRVHGDGRGWWWYGVLEMEVVSHVRGCQEEV